MSLQLLLRRTLLALAAASALAAPSSADVIQSGGLDQGFACEESSFSTCFTDRDFGFGTLIGPATGSITFTGPGPVFTVDLVLEVASALMPAQAEVGPGGFGGVENILFTDMVYTVSYSAFDTGFGLSGTGAPVGTVTGFYEQLDGALSTVVGPIAISESAVFSNLNCSPISATTSCGVSVGNFGDFDLSVGGGPTAIHDFRHTFNVLVPEPSTASLLILGLAGLARGPRTRR